METSAIFVLAAACFVVGAAYPPDLGQEIAETADRMRTVLDTIKSQLDENRENISYMMEKGDEIFTLLDNLDRRLTNLEGGGHGGFNETTMRPWETTASTTAGGSWGNSTGPLPQGHCSNGYVQCNNDRGCIPSRWMCDGDNDCGDYSDEACSTQPWNTTAATTGGDVTTGSWGNSTDPLQQGHCGYGYVQCNNGNCIHRSWMCDGDNDCLDYSDEACSTEPWNTTAATTGSWETTEETTGSWNTTATAPAGGSFGNGSYNGTGPLDQGHCSDSYVACDNGNCISRYWMCDGDNDCGDHSDEDVGECLRMDCGLQGRFNCARNATGTSFTKPVCVYREWICDGDLDCHGGEDEYGCDTVKRSDPVQKRNKYKKRFN